jgi:HTH-type transcriptional regulator, transcriptional repressor of NAD biosynthesis genes
MDTNNGGAPSGGFHSVNAGDPARRFGVGVVVGKFAPLHLGHEWLIEQASLQCGHLLILSYNNPEFDRCGVETRRHWLSTRFPKHEVHVFDSASLSRECAALGIPPRPLPKNNVSDEDQQRFLAWLLRCVLQRLPDALFCSETYGPSCAQRLTLWLNHPVESILVDIARANMPISGTLIRQNPHELRHWMSSAVHKTFIRRIVLLGGESSGKTTLTSALAARFETNWVPEYGRQLWEQQEGVLSETDLLKIAREQIRREDAALSSANRFVFCDTSPLTTAGYGGWMFGRVDAELAALARRFYDGIVLCNPDFAFVQDGTRRDETFRNQQHAWYREQLVEFADRVLVVSGDVQSRVAQVASWLSEHNLQAMV